MLMQQLGLEGATTFYTGAGLLGLLHRAGRADHVDARQAQRAQRLVTQTGVTAGNERGLARQVQTGDDLVRRGIEAVIAARDVVEGDGLARRFGFGGGGRTGTADAYC